MRLNLADREIDRVQNDTGKRYPCRTCGGKAAVTGRTVFYAPRRKGEGGLAVPDRTFDAHLDSDGSLCPASFQDCGQANLKAITEVAPR